MLIVTQLQLIFHSLALQPQYLPLQSADVFVAHEVTATELIKSHLTLDLGRRADAVGALNYLIGHALSQH